MVIFNKDNFVLTIEGDRETYLSTIKILNDAVTALTADRNGYDTYYINNLISSMLPDWRQLVNIDEAAQLDALKQRNRAAADGLIQAGGNDLNNV